MDYFLRDLNRENSKIDNFITINKNKFTSLVKANKKLDEAGVDVVGLINDNIRTFQIKFISGGPQIVLEIKNVPLDQNREEIPGWFEKYRDIENPNYIVFVMLYEKEKYTLTVKKDKLYKNGKINNLIETFFVNKKGCEIVDDLVNKAIKYKKPQRNKYVIVTSPKLNNNLYVTVSLLINPEDILQFSKKDLFNF